MSPALRLAELIDVRKDQYIALSDAIWEEPELRFEERAAAERLCRVLEEWGFAVERGAGGVETAFVATAGSGGGPVIGFLGEYDALPSLSQRAGVCAEEPLLPGGPGHGCGHNLLGVGALAAAVATRDYLAEAGIEGTVRYYGCPAEEGGGGKVLMVAAGLFRDVDAAITWHPSDEHYVFSASTLATQALEFFFTGRSAHAAKSPHTGRSALDAVELTNVGSNYLREHIPQEARLHYAIFDTGGNAPNVVQARAAVRYQIRSPKGGQVADVAERVCNIARGAALMTGTQVRIEEGARYLNIIPNTVVERLMQEGLEALGLPEVSAQERAFAAEVRTTLPEEERSNRRIPENGGAGDVAEALPPYRPHMSIHPASTDVGDVSWVVPTAQYRSAVWALGTQPHSWQAVAQGKTPFAHKGMLHAGKVMAATAVALFLQPGKLAEAKAELEKARESGVY